MENAIGSVPLYGISRDQVKCVRLLSDGSELKIADTWMVNNYPDIVFADLGEDPILPDPVDTVLEVTLKE